MLVALDIFLAIVTSATEVGNTRPSGLRNESVARIHEVGFYCLTSSTWDDLPSAYDSVPSSNYPDHADALLRDSYSGSNTPNAAVFEHPCAPLTKIISSGTFYYALEPYWDLSSRLSQRLAREDNIARDTGTYDDRFIWNEYIVRSLLDFRERLDYQERDDIDKCQFIVGIDMTQLARLHFLTANNRFSQYKAMWESIISLSPHPLRMDLLWSRPYLSFHASDGNERALVSIQGALTTMVTVQIL